MTSSNNPEDRTQNHVKLPHFFQKDRLFSEEAPLIYRKHMAEYCVPFWSL